MLYVKIDLGQLARANKIALLFLFFFFFLDQRSEKATCRLETKIRYAIQAITERKDAGKKQRGKNGYR